MNSRIIFRNLTYALILILVLLASCKAKTETEINPEYAKYISAFTHGRISTSSSIQIELTQDMPSVELNTPVEAKLFKFSPGIKGNAYWINAHTIKFIPEPGELKVGQEYKVTFELGKVMKVEQEFKEFDFYFHIPQQNFKLDLMYYSPIKNNDLSWNKVEGSLFLVDDAEISNIEKMFSLSGEEASKAKIKISPTDTKGKYSILIDSLLRSEQKDLSYVLKTDGSVISSKHKVVDTIFIPKIDPNAFHILNAEMIKETQMGVRITFSDPLSPDQNMEGLVSIDEGSQDYTRYIDGNTLTLYLDGNLGLEDRKIDVIIYKEIKNYRNKPLDRTYSYNFTIINDKPRVELLGSSNILPNSDNLVIPFKSVNLWAVDVKVIKIFENNILGYLQSNDFGQSDELKRFGRLVAKKRIRLDKEISMDLSKWNNFSIDMAKLIKQDPGCIYRVEIITKKEYSLYKCDGEESSVPSEDALEGFDNNLSETDLAEWDQPSYYSSSYYDWNYFDWEEKENPCHPSYFMGEVKSCMVISSNIGMTAKTESKNKLTVITNNIITTQPISGAKVDVYNFQMQRIGSGTTNNDGFASIEYKGGAPYVVIAEKEKEKGYLKVSPNLALSLSNFDVSGKETTKGLKGYIYGERGVWRPGDSIYLTFVLEDKEKVLPHNHPVSLELFTPRGQLSYRTVRTESVDGFYSFNMATDPDAITGNWQTKINVGGVNFYKMLKIETIKPNRLKIRLDAGEMIDASKGSFTAQISSQWLHGAPASNLKAKVEMKLTPVSNPFEKYNKFTFSNPINKFVSDSYTLFEGSLDANGNAQVNSDLPTGSNAPGILKANIVSQVFESGGDASIYAQSIPYSPYSSYVGIKAPTNEGSMWLETDTNNPIELVTLDKDSKLVNGKVSVKIYKIKWSWWWSNNYEDLQSYVNSTSTEIVLNQTVTTHKGKGTVDFRIDYPNWGRYLVVAKNEESGHIAGKTIYVDWPEWRGRSSKDDPEGLTMLSFASDKEKYNVGDKATITLPKSSNGRTLISLEQGDKILSKDWIQTSASSDTQYSFKITEEMAPNVYISASLLQPHNQGDNDLPIRMYGVININVENKETILNPVLQMPDELRPEKEFSVTVSEKNKKDMTYTLAIVDEGLLDLTAFKTPNAWNDFYARQSLSVRTWDMYDLVVNAKGARMGQLLSIGGDEELEASDNKMSRFKPVVKFIGPFSLKAGKSATHKIILPPYFGSVRAMVIAGNKKGAYGNAEKAVKVKNPLMVLSTLPRVAGPEEEILLPVNVFAMDDKVKKVTVNVESNGLFEFTDGKSKNVTFSEIGDKMVYFKVKVAKRIGQEKVVIKVSGGGESITETIDIEIRNPNPQILLSEQALVKSKDEATLELSLDGLQNEDWVKMEVSRMPGINFNKNLSFLRSYPHGCSEQVTSKVFPQLYIGAFRKLSDKEKEMMDYHIKEGIKILTARQLGDGGIVYWPGYSYPTEWVTSYAGHFLLEAQRMGYSVSPSVISKLIKFQKRGSQNWNRRDLYNSYYSHSMTDLQQAYRLYTLALAGEPELGAMNRLKEMDNLSQQARWRLAAAYVLAGKKEVAKQLVDKANDKVDNYSFNNNTYGSASRDMAMIMETHILLDNIDKALNIAQNVSKTLSAEYISTQDAAYGLIAMSKLAEKMGKGTVSYEWYVNGKKQPMNSDGNVFQEMDIKPETKVSVRFKNLGEGQLFVRLLGRTQPLGDKIPAQSGDVKLYVKYLDENDTEIDVQSLKQGTEFYATVLVQNTSGEYQTDMVLNQIFASGWEIFNERLFSSGDSNANYNYRDLRDDRAMTYFNIGSGYSVTYRVRLQAAYCGRFFLPGVSSEGMYNPNEQTRTTGQWVEVVQ